MKIVKIEDARKKFSDIEAYMKAYPWRVSREGRQVLVGIPEKLYKKKGDGKSRLIEPRKTNWKNPFGFREPLFIYVSIFLIFLLLPDIYNNIYDFALICLFFALMMLYFLRITVMQKT